jgi:hypothetical protein
MLSAKEARDSVPEGVLVTPARQLKEIDEKIREAVRLGQEEIWTSDELLQYTVNELKHLGYNIRPHRNMFGEKTTASYISWGRNYK